MSGSNVRRSACWFWIAAVLAACGAGEQPALLQDAQGLAAPRPTASPALVYVSSYAADTVTVYSEKHLKVVGGFGGFDGPGGLCVDAAQNVYVTNGYDYDIIEYRHGGTQPIRSLTDPNGFPWACSVDPTTGDLAVVNGVSLGKNDYGILIYPKARGTPKFYVDPDVYAYWYCGYDDRGNLYFDGENSDFNETEVGYLRSDKQFSKLTLSQAIRYPGGVQWDGTYLAIGDQGTSTIYRFSVRGSRGKLEGTTVLGDATDVDQFWIDGQTVVGADYRSDLVQYWNYPAGGDPIESTSLETPQGVTVSR